MKSSLALVALAIVLCYAEDKKDDAKSNNSNNKSKKRGIYDEGNHINFDVNLLHPAPFPQRSSAHLGSGEIIYGKPYGLNISPLPPLQDYSLGSLYTSGQVNHYAQIPQYQQPIQYSKIPSPPLPLTLPLVRQTQIQSGPSFISYKAPQIFKEIFVREHIPDDTPYSPQPLIRATVAKPVALGSGALGYIKLANGGIALGSGSLGYGGNSAPRGRPVEAIGENAFRNIAPLVAKGPVYVTEDQLQGLGLQQFQGIQGLQGYQGLQGIGGLQYGGFSAPSSPVYNKVPVKYTNVLAPSLNLVQHSSQPNFEFLQSSYVKGLY